MPREAQDGDGKARKDINKRPVLPLVKKLKLIGHPMKIHHNTAFIKDMFTSSLEVGRFEGALLKSVSGIRGQIKRAIKAPDGAFRATFEDKLLMSDIVFMRAWVPVVPKRFYNVLTDLLTPSAAPQSTQPTGEAQRSNRKPTAPTQGAAHNEAHLGAPPGTWHLGPVHARLAVPRHHGTPRGAPLQPPQGVRHPTALPAVCNKAQA